MNSRNKYFLGIGFTLTFDSCYNHSFILLKLVHSSRRCESEPNTSTHDISDDKRFHFQRHINSRRFCIRETNAYAFTYISELYEYDIRQVHFSCIHGLQSNLSALDWNVWVGS